MTGQVPGLRYQHHADSCLLRRLHQWADTKGSLAVGDVANLAAGAELVVRELGLQRGNHPAWELTLDEREHRDERLFGREATPGHRMDMGPVDDRADERILRGQHRNVAEAPERPIVARRLQTHAHPQRFDLGDHRIEPGSDPIHEDVGLLGVVGPEVGDDHRRRQRLAQFHRVLQGGQGLTPTVLVGQGQAGEVGSVHREPDVTFDGQLAECLATLLLPGKAVDEGQLEGPMTLCHQLIEELLIGDVLGGQAGDPEADAAHSRRL